MGYVLDTVPRDALNIPCILLRRLVYFNLLICRQHCGLPGVTSLDVYHTEHFRFFRQLAP